MNNYKINDLVIDMRVRINKQWYTVDAINNTDSIELWDGVNNDIITVKLSDIDQIQGYKPQRKVS